MPTPGRRPLGAMALVLGAFAAFGAVAAPARPAGAQAPGPELSLSAGAMQFDASGTGVAPTAAARAALPVAGRWLLAEGSLAYAALGEQFAPSPTRVAAAVAQLQLQAPLGPVRPYLGVGGGWVRYLSNAGGQPAAPGTLSGAAGLRVAVSGRLGVRGELRVRGWQRTSDGDFGFVNSAAEYTGGVTYAF